VNVRSGPGAEYEEIGMAAEGDRIPIVDMKQNWYRIVLGDGRVGWVPRVSADVDTLGQ
jgi:uncharacterized protein YgiM (DUF1202 family)